MSNENQNPTGTTVPNGQGVKDVDNNQKDPSSQPKGRKKINKAIKIPLTSISFDIHKKPHFKLSPSTKRFQEIIGILTKHRAIESLAFQKNPENVRLAFEELGPTFIKIGQILSTHTDMVSQEFATELEKLQSSVKNKSFVNMKPLIEKHAGMPIKKLFLSLDETPFASASIADVYKGVLKNGSPVVVKVQHPGVSEKMMLDITLLEKAIPLIKFVPGAKSVEPSEIIKILKEALINELDFEKEAENIEVFYNNNKYEDTLVCLRVYREFSNKQFLVMDFMEGNDIGVFANDENIDAKKKTDLSALLVDNYMKQIFSDGFFHADPHPGNILINISDDNLKITFIDFGMVGKLDNSSIQKLNELLLAVTSGKTEEICKSLINICHRRGKVNETKLNSDVSKVFGEYFNMSIIDYDSSKLFGELISLCSKNNLILPQDLTLAFKGIVTIEGIARQLDPSVSMQKLIAPYVEKYMLTHLDLMGEIKKYIHSVIESGVSIPKIPVQISELIEQTKKGDLTVKFDHSGLDNFGDQMESTINRLTMGIIIASIIIGSSFLVRFNSGLLGIFATILGTIGFIIAIIMGISILWSSLRKKKR